MKSQFPITIRDKKTGKLKVVETIEVEVEVFFGEEFLTPESSQLVEETRLWHMWREEVKYRLENSSRVFQRNGYYHIRFGSDKYEPDEGVVKNFDVYGCFHPFPLGNFRTRNLKRALKISKKH